MQRIKLGKSDLEVPVLCLGGNVYGWTLAEADSFRQLDQALEAGLNFIDTADVYSRWVPGHHGGESETILGKWLAKGNKRSNVIVATKVGIEMGEGKKGLKPAYIAQAVEDSLRRLQTDYIDLYQAHKDDEETPLEETLSAFDKLVRQGKVRHIGASNYSGPRLQEALQSSKDNGLVSYVSLQPQYNLVAREDFETNLLPVVQEHTLGVIPYYALAAGFLTGKYRSKQDAEGKARGGSVSKYLNDWGGSPETPRNARAGSAGLADGAARHHRSHRQRHQRPTPDRHSRSQPTEAGSRFAGETERCQHRGCACESLNSLLNLQGQRWTAKWLAPTGSLL
jgi:aryl-alcohol dehydrogenase-like predicted oxidoreductase